MAIEIEKKYRLDKKLLVEMEAKLRELNAVFVDDVFEENYLHRGQLLRPAARNVRQMIERLNLQHGIAP